MNIGKTGGGGDLNQEVILQRLLKVLPSFAFTPPQKRIVWEAFKACPEGLERCAMLSQAKGRKVGGSGAGLLLTMISMGEHCIVAMPDTPLPTGWRFVRGEGGAAGTYVQDPAGTDRLPPGYDFRTQNRITGSVRYPDETEPLTDEVRKELRKIGVRC